MEIPTKTIKLSENKEIKLKSWTTQSQDDEYQRIMFGDQEFNTNQDEPELTSNLSKYNEAIKYLVSSLLADLTYEEYDQLSPTDRKLIQNEALEIKKGV